MMPLVKFKFWKNLFVPPKKHQLTEFNIYSLNEKIILKNSVLVRFGMANYKDLRAHNEKKRGRKAPEPSAAFFSSFNGEKTPEKGASLGNRLFAAAANVGDALSDMVARAAGPLAEEPAGKVHIYINSRESFGSWTFIYRRIRRRNCDCVSVRKRQSFRWWPDSSFYHRKSTQNSSKKTNYQSDREPTQAFLYDASRAHHCFLHFRHSCRFIRFCVSTQDWCL